MKQWFALSAIGRDRPGIVADLAELIYECDCNLEDSSMTILGSEFAVLLRSPANPGIAERLSSAANAWVGARRSLFVLRPSHPYRASRTPPATRPGSRVAGGDRRQAVRCLADQQVNVAQLQTVAPEPGGTIYRAGDGRAGKSSRGARERLDVIARTCARRVGGCLTRPQAVKSDPELAQPFGAV
jgi:glycine cleavage system transcriptional repressor